MRRSFFNLGIWLISAATVSACAMIKPSTSKEMISTKEVASTPRASAGLAGNGTSESEAESEAEKDWPKDPKLVEQSEKAVYHFSMGQAYSLNNETDKAVEAYRATLAYDPNSALVRARLAAELVKKGEFREAKTLCEEAIKLDPNYVDAFLLLAGIQVVAKELDAALATYESVLKGKKDHRDTLLYYGTTLAESGRLTDARRVLERLVKLEEDPDSQVDEAVAWYYLAKVQTQMEDFSDSARSLRQAVSVRPSYTRAALFLADLYIAEDEPDKAIKVMKDSYVENPASSLATRLAAYHLSISQFEKAVPYLEALAEVEVDNISAKVRLALVYWQVNWLTKAYTVLREVHQAFPSSNEVLYYLGELELERKKFKSAISYFNKVDSSYGRYEESVARVVASFQELEKFEDAKTFLLKELKKRKDIISFYTMYGRLFEADNQLAQAIRFLERNFSQIEKSESALYYLGYLYDRAGSAKKGLNIMEQILKKNPDNANALNYIGYTLLEKGKELARAKEYLARALSIKPNDAYIMDSYGWFLFKQGDTKGALKLLEQAAVQKPNEGVILEHVADVYMELNLNRKALAMYEKALSNLTEAKDQVRVQNKIFNVETILGMRDPKRLRSPASRK